jgi:oligopeptide/dipeptide ABC transporter ATP-binding protein
MTRIADSRDAHGRNNRHDSDRSEPLLELIHLKVYYPIRRGLIFGRTAGHIHAVDDVSLSIYAGETVGIVGESGCGKTTLARSMVRLVEPTAGEIYLGSEEITHAKQRRLQALRRQVQIVFQDPQSSLNPRHSAERIIGAPVRYAGQRRADATARARELLELVGLKPEDAGRFPHEFSGGQRQRIGIARALAVNPSLLVLDEPVSALDVSVQAQVINLLSDIQEDLGLAYVFVAHDLSVVRHVSDRIAVMYLGQIVELAPAEELYRNPRHPYTAALLASSPVPDPTVEMRGSAPIMAEPSDPSDPPSGCRFRTRCPRAAALCAQKAPALATDGAGRLAACHFPLTDGEA